MKLFILFSSIFLISSCTYFKFNVSTSPLDEVDIFLDNKFVGKTSVDSTVRVSTSNFLGLSPCEIKFTKGTQSGFLIVDNNTSKFENGIVDSSNIAYLERISPDISANNYYNLIFSVNPDSITIPERNKSQSNTIEKELPINKIKYTNPKERKNIGILDLEGIGISQVEALGLTKRLRTELFRTSRFVILERDRMKEIFSEQGFQQSGCTSSECLIEAGKVLNMQMMVGGSVSKIGKYFSIELRLINIETGEIVSVSTVDIKGNIGEVLIHGIKEAASKLL